MRYDSPVTGDCAIDDGLSAFERARPRLLGIAYRMLGSITDAEEVVQDVWTRWQSTDRRVVREPQAFLATTTRLAINVLQSARTRTKRTSPLLNRGHRQESGGGGLVAPAPPSERSIDLPFRLRGPVDDQETLADIAVTLTGIGLTRKRTSIMKLVIIGGTGLIGSKLVAKLREHGHEAVPAALDTGVNTLTGEGLAEALQGASVVVDVSNSPSFEDAAVMEFFTTSTRNLLKAAGAAGVTHYVALSVVGTERIPDSPYLRAKNAQETLIKSAGIPYSIVRATQFFEFVTRIADEATVGTTVRLPSALIQPMAADDVAKSVGEIAAGAPVNGTVEVAGPQQFRFDELIRQGLAARSDPREVVVDLHARYFGAELGERSLIPGSEARLGEIRFEEWLGQPLLQQRN